MRITLILAYLLLTNIAYGENKVLECNPKKYTLEAGIDYYDLRTKKSSKIIEPIIRSLTIKEKYLDLIVSSQSSHPIKKVKLLGSDLEIPFLIKKNKAVSNISTLNISLYEELIISIEDNKGQTCEMVLVITRD